jgi:hypothetical protein
MQGSASDSVGRVRGEVTGGWVRSTLPGFGAVPLFAERPMVP